MRKQLLTLIASTFLFIGCKKEKTPQVEKKLLKIEATMIPYEFGEPSFSNKFRWSRQEFNDVGEVVLSTKRFGTNDLDASKSYEDQTIFKYDNGRLVEMKESTYRYTYKYEGEDTVEIKKYGTTGILQIENIEYDSNRRKSKTNTYSSDNSLFETRIYKYDTFNNNSTIDILYSPFVEGNQLIYTFDSKGNVLTESYFNKERNTTTLQAQFGYKYDDRGKLSEYTKNIFYTIRFRKWKNLYNEEGNLIKQDLFESDKFNGNYIQVGLIEYQYFYK